MVSMNRRNDYREQTLLFGVVFDLCGGSFLDSVFSYLMTDYSTSIFIIWWVSHVVIMIGVVLNWYSLAATLTSWHSG